MTMPALARRWGWHAGALALLLLAPLVVDPIHLTISGTHALWLAVGAMSLTFLAGYGGMVSLAQSALAGVAGVALANLTVRQGAPVAVAVLCALVITVAVSLLLGWVARRTEGTYLLMLTLAFAVLVNYQAQQTPSLAGHAGITGVDPPSVIGDPTNAPVQLYFVTLGVAVVVFLGLRHLLGAPFGIAMQGVRDQAGRMPALGFRVGVVRTVAFGIAGLVAAFSGVMSTWYNTQVGPDSFSLNATIQLLIIAVIGGLGRLEGAWIGALLFAIMDNYVRQYTDRFDTVIGLVFLVIVTLMPGGIAGVSFRRRRPDSAVAPDAPEAAGPEAPPPITPAPHTDGPPADPARPETTVRPRAAGAR